MNRPIILQGKKVALVPMQEEDLKSFYFWLNDLNVTRALSTADELPLTKEQEESWYEENIKKKPLDKSIFGIMNLENEKIIGTVSLEKIEIIAQGAQLGIVIGDKNCWGQGFGKEAITLILDYGFNKLNRNVIYLQVRGFHERAKKIYSKIGFKESGRFRAGCYHGGRFYDVILMDMLKDEYNNLYPSQIK